jgi:hypothetical protein
VFSNCTPCAAHSGERKFGEREREKYQVLSSFDPKCCHYKYFIQGDFFLLLVLVFYVNRCFCKTLILTCYHPYTIISQASQEKKYSNLERKIKIHKSPF